MRSIPSRESSKYLPPTGNDIHKYLLSLAGDDSDCMLCLSCLKITSSSATRRYGRSLADRTQHVKGVLLAYQHSVVSGLWIAEKEGWKVGLTT